MTDDDDGGGEGIDKDLAHPRALELSVIATGFRQLADSWDHAPDDIAVDVVAAQPGFQSTHMVRCEPLSSILRLPLPNLHA